MDISVSMNCLRIPHLKCILVDRRRNTHPFYEERLGGAPLDLPNLRCIAVSVDHYDGRVADMS